MKKVFTILLAFISLTMFSQVKEEIKYPKFEVDSLGQKVVTMTIPQAMKLNNNSNLLEKFEKLATEMKDYENVSIKVINEKDETITKLDVVITKLDGQILIKDEKIKALQNEILEWMRTGNILEEQLANRNKIIDERDKQLRKLKFKMIVGGIGGVAIIVPLVLKVVGIIK